MVEWEDRWRDGMMMKVTRKLERTANPIVFCVATLSFWPALNACAGDSLPARLAVEHCTHEARGLDVLPQTIGRFRNNGDAKTAEILEVCGAEAALRCCWDRIAAILESTRSARQSCLVLRNAGIVSVIMKPCLYAQFHNHVTCSLTHVSDRGVRGGDLALRCRRAMAALSSQSSARRAHVAVGAGRRGRGAIGDSRNTRLGAGGSAVRDGGGLVPRADQGPLSRPLEAAIQ